jgi:tetratricopeptide (TPR) repeat protein
MQAHGNLAKTLWSQGDLPAARRLQEESLAIHRSVLGPEHPNTSIVAWNLFLTLQDLGDHSAAAALLDRYLKWLPERDPATLSADLRKIYATVAEQIKKSG